MVSEVKFYKEENFRVVEADGFKMELPEEWGVVRLGDISDIKGRIGWHGLKDEDYLNKGGYYLVRGIDFEDGKIKWERCVYISKEWYERDPNIQLSEGDILVTKDGTIGKVALVNYLPKKATLGTGVFRIRLTEKCYPYFVYYIFMSKYFERFIILLKAGSTLSHLYQKDLIKFHFPLPPLPEQQKIARVLMSIDRAIEVVDEAIKQAERIKKGLMQELLTKGIGHKEFKDTKIGRIPKEWEVVRLGDIAKLESGGTPSRQKPEYWENGTIPWVKSGELNDGVIYDTEEKITELGLKNSSAKIFSKGTLLIALYGATVGKTGVLGIDASTNQAVCAIFPKSSDVFDSRFLQYCLIFYRSRLISQSSGGAQPNIYLYVLRDFRLPLPLLSEQQKIAEILSKWDEVIELKRGKKERLERMKKKVMDLLLTGKVRIK
jgi:type I restriction enzyme S subunit